MNKLLLLLFSILIASCATKQKEPSLAYIQLIDRNGLSETICSKERLSNYMNSDFLETQPYQKVVRIFSKNKCGQTPSILTGYHPNGQIGQYLEALNGRAFGFYREWFPDGQKKIEAFLIGGPADLSISAKQEWIFDKTCKVWDENGHLVSEISYKKGSLEGPSFYYYSAGEIKKKENYLHNKLHGEIIKYKKNGNILAKTLYEKGKKEGFAYSNFTNGKLLCVENYSANLLINGDYFDQDKNKVAEIRGGNGKKAFFKGGILFKLIEYKKGIKEGKVETFFETGSLKNTSFVKNGQKEGEEIELYPNGQKKMLLFWKNAMIHGSVKTWYQNGVLESEREFCQNKKNGKAYGWYESGIPMLEEEYENDFLKKGIYYKNKEIVSSVINGNGTVSIFDGSELFLKSIKYKNGNPVKE